MRARSNELTVKSCMPQRNWGEWGEEGDIQRADADEEKGVHFFKNSKFLQGCPDCPTGLSFKFVAHKLVAAEMGFSSGETNR